jgi:hypothetical protein
MTLSNTEDVEASVEDMMFGFCIQLTSDSLTDTG